MALNAKNQPAGGGGGSKFKKPPALDSGTYPGRLVQLIDLGVQSQRAWQGQEKPPMQTIYTTYELSDEFLLDEEGNELEDKPRWISEDFPLHHIGSDLAKSTKRYFAIDPKNEHEGDWSQLMGAPVNITISSDKDKKGKKDEEGNVVVYNNISSLQTVRPKDASRMPELKNDVKVFDMDAPDMEVYLSLPKWLRDRIKEAHNFKGSALDSALEGVDEDAENKARREDKQEKDQPAKKEEVNDEEDW